MPEQRQQRVPFLSKHDEQCAPIIYLNLSWLRSRVATPSIKLLLINKTNLRRLLRYLCSLQCLPPGQSWHVYYNQEALLLLPLVEATAEEFLCSPEKEERPICKVKPENTCHGNNYLHNICNCLQTANI